MDGMILQRLALDHASRARALVVVFTTDGAMILDQHIPSIGALRDFRDASKNMIVESFLPGTDPKVYQRSSIASNLECDRHPTGHGIHVAVHVHGQLSHINIPYTHYGQFKGGGRDLSHREKVSGANPRCATRGIQHRAFHDG
jgi:hypothetical protein